MTQTEQQLVDTALQLGARVRELEEALRRINGMAQNTCFNVSQMADDWTLDKQAVLRNADDIASVCRAVLPAQAEQSNG